MSHAMIKYSATVREVGPLVDEFIAAGVLVFFGLDAPEELKDFAILHDGSELVAEVAPGDRFCVDDHCFTILAVGEVANQNLRALGHFVIKFNGQTVPEMPGDICAEARPLPPIGPGSRMVIHS